VPDLPIGLEELGIDGLESTATTGGIGLGNPIDQILVVGDGLDFRRHGGESQKLEGGRRKAEFVDHNGLRFCLGGVRKRSCRI
jgi:hypothetical protein